ncbi:MAG: insulinase family protein [Bacteroidetes bacterium]|nr:insulinase family protein [Bacteroidota bacterium]
MNRSIAPPIDTIDTITLPEIKQVKLDNKVPVYLLNEGDQDVIKVELMFRAGKWYEPKNLMADIISRMLREGTTKHNAKQIADSFDYYGASFNTGAGFETAGASLYSLTKHIDKLLPLAFETFSESNFPEHELVTIVANKKQKLRVELEKNDFIANRNFVQALYGSTHPYGRITEFSDFEQITTDDLKAFYKKYYTGSNLTIIVSGKFDDKIIKGLNQYFGNNDWVGERGLPILDYPIEASETLVHHTDKADSVQSAVVVGNLSINKTHPDFLKLSIMNTVFGGYFGSRLMKNIREERGFTYGIYSSLASYPHGAFIEIASEVGKEVREATLNEIEHEINLLRTELVGEEELSVVKNYMSGKILRSIDGPIKFSETLKNLIIYGQDTSYIHQYLRAVREITAEQIMETANKYLDYDKMYKVTVG